jgi:hypothetical protein
MPVITTNAQDWSENVFGQAKLGDARRTQRLVTVGKMLASHTGRSALAASEGNSALSEGAYRLFRNDAIDVDAIADSGFAATAKRVTNYSELLAVEDTTTLSYAHRVTTELGDMGGKANSQQRGFHVHSVLLVDPLSEDTVGLIAQQRWCRDTAKRGQRHQNKSRAYEEKESYKWQSASEQVVKRLGNTMSRVIAVCDREADVYEYLMYKIDTQQRYIIRACWDRRLEDDTDNLFVSIAQTPPLGEHTITITQRGGAHGRAARQVCLTLHSQRVTLQAPKRMGAKLEPIEVNAVLAQELNPPKGEDSLCWLLLTSEPVDDLMAAQKILHCYSLRWRIEDFHKAWKSGAKVEKQRMQSADNLERVAVILAFIAVRLLQLREGFTATNKKLIQPCNVILEEVQWRILWVTTEKEKPPNKVPSQQWAYYAIAKLGGWMDTKGTGRVGWNALWQGWFRLTDRVEAYISSRDLVSDLDM